MGVSVEERTRTAIVLTSASARQYVFVGCVVEHLRERRESAASISVRASTYYRLPEKVFEQERGRVDEGVHVERKKTKQVEEERRGL